MPASASRPLAGLRRCAAALVAASLAAAGCGREPAALEVSHLRPHERQFVERFVVLERARAVALADPAVGASLLDSLAAAWGDTAGRAISAELSTNPHRAALVHDLLRRLLEAEADSLLFAPHSRRLVAPLPAPAPPGTEPLID